MGDQRAHPQVAAYPSRVGEGDEDVVVDDAAGPAPVELGVNRGYRPEQYERLVDHVGAKVVK